jgi:hypothetical protein
MRRKLTFKIIFLVEKLGFATQLLSFYHYWFGEISCWAVCDLTGAGMLLFGKIHDINC